MRRFLFLFPAAIAACAATAQQSNIPIDAGLHIQAGASYWNVKLESFDRFQQSYNTFFASRIQTPLEELRPTSSYSYGAGAYIGPLYFNLMQHRLDAEISADFKNGDRREIKLQMRPLDMNFDLMIPAGKRLVVGMALGMQLQKARIYSGYRYAGQDVLSYSTLDNPLNGIYDAFSTSSLTAGLRTDVKLVKRKGKSLLTLSLRGDYVGAFQKMLGSESTSKLLPHRDEMNAAATGGYVYSDGTLHKYLPVEAKDQFNEYVFFVGTGGEAVNNTFRGWRGSVSLLLTPFEWRLN